MTITPDRLAELKRLTEEAPAEPDLIDVTPFDSARGEYGPSVAVVETRTAEFYAVAREAVPDVLDEREQMLALLREAEGMLRIVDEGDDCLGPDGATDLRRRIAAVLRGTR